MLLEGLLARSVAVKDYRCLFDYLAALLVPGFGVLSFLGDLFWGWMRLWGAVDGGPEWLDVFVDLFKGWAILVLFVWFLEVRRMVEVGRCPCIFVYFLVSSILSEARSGWVSVVRTLSIDTGSSSSQLQSIFCQIEDSDELIAFYFRLTANVTILWIEDGLPMSSVSHSIVNYESKHCHFCVVSVF